MRETGLFLLLAVVLGPFLSSFLDAAFVRLIGWGESGYWQLWRTRFFANVLAALIIVPCSSVHTFFMRFVIDVVFVDREGVVLKTVSDLKPWRIAIGARAHAVIELNAGGVRRSELVVGDHVSLRESTLRA